MGGNRRNLATLVSRRFKILDSLYPDNEYYLKELADESEIDRSNLSGSDGYIKELEKASLVSTRKERERPKGRPRKYVSLTSEGHSIVRSYYEATEREEVERVLRDPDDEEIGFLIEQIENPESDEILDLAVKDLLRSCKETRVWDFEYPSPKSLEEGKIWPLVEDLLEGNENERDEALSFLLTVLKNASQENREEVVESIGDLFDSYVKELAGIKPYSKPTQILEMILTKEEEWDFYAPKLKEGIRKKIRKNETLQPVLPKLERFKEWNQKKLRRWFYEELLSDDDSEVRERSQQLYNKIM